MVGGAEVLPDDHLAAGHVVHLDDDLVGVVGVPVGDPQLQPDAQVLGPDAQAKNS